MRQKNIIRFNNASIPFFILLLSILLSTVPFLSAQEKGKISGVIIDKSTQQPLPGANIIVVNSLTGTASDADGKFIIPNLSVGNYTFRQS